MFSTRFRTIAVALPVLALLCAAATPTAHAEVAEVKIAMQFGISYLPLMVLEEKKLVEKYAAAAGIPNLKVSYPRINSGQAISEGLTKGDLHIGSGGVAPLISAWARAAGAGDGEIKAIASMNIMPIYLNVKSDTIKSLRDLGPNDRIALPAAKTSIQAITLQMAAAKEFGADQFAKFDAQTVTMSHPDGNKAFAEGKVAGHFSAPPFQYRQLKDPKVKSLLNSYDVLDGVASFNLVWATAKFRRENPKVYKAFLDALKEGVTFIDREREPAADLYLRVSKDTAPKAEVLAILNDPVIRYGIEPRGTFKYSNFMHKTGAIKTKPGSWKDMFFSEAHALSGS